MQTRKEQLFNAAKVQRPANIIPATVKFELDRSRGEIKPLAAPEKMLVALRKVLAQMSEKNPDGCRYYIAGNKVELTSTPTTTSGKKGEVQTYRAAGRARLGVAHSTHSTKLFIAFDISYRDCEDDRGLADVEFIDPTTIDVIDRAGPVNLQHLS
jgi:acetylornithine deacetylase/succinyl-diaminopimelate desuccinylase-like protein